MKEIRVSNLQTETRNTEDNAEEQLILVGYPIVFDQATEIKTANSSFKEIIKRGALDGVDLNDTRLLYNHDNNKIPLSRSGKTMTLTVDEVGLHMRAVLPNTEEGRSVYTAVERGDLDKMSFAFTVMEDGQDYNAETNTRVIRKINKLYEVSIVPFPAYEGTVVSVEARNQMREQQETFSKRKKLEMKLKLI